MSGPKVVRIVTREELTAISLSLLRQLDQVILTLTQEGRELGQLDDVNLERVRRQRARFDSLLSEAKFAELQRHVPQEIAYVEQGVEQQRRRAIEARTQALVQQKQQRENAAALSKALRMKKPPATEAMLTDLQSVQSGGITGKEAERVLAQGFLFLSNITEATGLTDAQKNLAKQLAKDQRGKSFAEWLSKNAKRGDVRLKSIYRQLSELSVRLGATAVSAFHERIRAIESEMLGPNRDMHLDSLIVDISIALTSANENSRVAHEATLVLADLRGYSQPQVVHLQRDLEAALEASDVGKVASMMNAARTELDKARKAEAAESRRAAILNGLSALGYEVREGMSTAWASNGRIVLGKPTTPGYGVEVAGASDVGRLQVRAVAFAATRNTSRDRDIETIWCGEFAKLQELLAQSGSSLRIERALGVGEVPLKTTESSTDESISAKVLRDSR